MSLIKKMLLYVMWKVHWERTDLASLATSGRNLPYAHNEMVSMADDFRWYPWRLHLRQPSRRTACVAVEDGI